METPQPTQGLSDTPGGLAPYGLFTPGLFIPGSLDAQLQSMGIFGKRTMRRVSFNISFKINRRYIRLWSSRILKLYTQQRTASLMVKRDAIHVRRLIRIAAELDDVPFPQFHVGDTVGLTTYISKRF